MPSVEDVCSAFSVCNVEIEYSEEELQSLTTYKAFMHHVRPILQKENPKIAAPKLVMLVAAKWREFCESNPHIQQEGGAAGSGGSAGQARSVTGDEPEEPRSSRSSRNEKPDDIYEEAVEEEEEYPSTSKRGRKRKEEKQAAKEKESASSGKS